MTKITEFRSGSTERMGKLPKITQHRCGKTERLGNLPKITELRSGSTENLNYLPKITDGEETKVERFYEDPQDLLELTPKKDVLFIMGTRMQIESQEITWSNR